MPTDLNTSADPHLLVIYFKNLSTQSCSTIATQLIGTLNCSNTITLSPPHNFAIPMLLMTQVADQQHKSLL